MVVRKTLRSGSGHFLFTVMAVGLLKILAMCTLFDLDITSCGLTTKTLNKSAIFTDGTYLVIVIGQSNGSVASRSLFGASSLSKGVVVLLFFPYRQENGFCVGVATSWCFHLAQGDSRGRMELSGIGSNAFARGSAVEGAG